MSDVSLMFSRTRNVYDITRKCDDCGQPLLWRTYIFRRPQHTRIAQSLRCPGCDSLWRVPAPRMLAEQMLAIAVAADG